MGLTCGAHGVKTQIKQTFPGALRDFPDLETCRVASGHRVEQCAVLLDGNVLINQIPTVVTDFEGYVRVFQGFVKAAFRAGDHVVVVFDEPDHVTKAKAAEQKKRDASRKKGVATCSVDIAESLAPRNDEYDAEVVARCNPHDLLANRAARGRFYDELLVTVMKRQIPNLADNQTLTLDGIDHRGAARPRGEGRIPDVFSSNEMLEPLLTRRQPGVLPIGEGDLKLPEMAGEIQRLRNEGVYFKDVEIILTSTIDTDAIAIELLHQSAKNEAAAASKEEGSETGRTIKSILCFRERSGKRENGDAPKAMYACFDLEMLHSALVSKLFGPSVDENLHLHKFAIALVSALWALCGCDFLKLSGMRSDAALDAAVEICRNEPSSLREMRACFELGRSAPAAEVNEAKAAVGSLLKKAVGLASIKLGELPRMQKACASTKAVAQDDLLKATWTVFYWSGLEFTDLENFGFVV